MLLTIAIPTYQRPEFLAKALRGIGRQIEGRDDVAVHVYDDSDGAVNAGYIDTVRREFPRANIGYSLNAKNLGIDENIKQCLISTDSDYIWLLGEDDLLTEGAVARVLEAIQRFRPVFVFANYIYADDQHHKFARSAVLPEQLGQRLCRFNDFVAEWGWALGFIGGCIVRAADWRRQNIEAFAGSFYSHVGGIIDAALGQDIVVIGDIQVLNRAEDVNTFTWSRSTFKVYFSFYEVLAVSRLAQQPALLAVVKRSAAYLFNVHSLLWLAAKRADGVYDLKAFNLHYRQQLDRGAAWKAAAWLLAIAPRVPLRWLRSRHLKHRFSRSWL